MSFLLLFRTPPPQTIAVESIDGATLISGVVGVLNSDGASTQTLILASIDGATAPVGPVLVSNASSTHRPW